MCGSSQSKCQPTSEAKPKPGQLFKIQKREFEGILNVLKRRSANGCANCSSGGPFKVATHWHLKKKIRTKKELSRRLKSLRDLLTFYRWEAEPDSRVALLSAFGVLCSWKLAPDWLIIGWWSSVLCFLIEHLTLKGSSALRTSHDSGEWCHPWLPFICLFVCFLCVCPRVTGRSFSSLQAGSWVAGLPWQPANRWPAGANIVPGPVREFDLG